MQRISAVVIAGNEEKNIAGCLESLRWADEVVVVNSESTDKTVEIAKEFTDKVFIRKWEGYASQKSFAVEQARNNWVLSLDADERVSPELQEEIARLDFGRANGFFIPRRNYFLDKVIRSCGWSPDYQMRLFDKSRARMKNRPVHEGFMIDGGTEHLKGEIIHYTHMTISDAMRKSNEFSALSAIEKSRRRQVKGRHIFFLPAYAFFHHYVMRRGFTEGVHGLMVSLIHAVTNLQTQLRIWEMQNVREKK
ncbi:MAG: glycosyltransferase family 2 protein [Bacteroidetes bacterium]|nr:glycosyltransferase family 2 protein [Bacteroidota bacterium]